MTRQLDTRRAVIALVLAAACSPRSAPVPARLEPQPSIVPAPVSLHIGGGGAFTLRDSAVIVTDGGGNADVARVAGMLARLLHIGSGYAITVRDGGATPRGGIRLRLDASRGDLGEEGYALTTTADSVLISARTPAGVYYGFQTLRQLFSYLVESDIGRRDTLLWKIPAVSIRDVPRYAWRGAMLDVARHFFTVDEVKQYIDLIALYKLNRLHLHLTDDQGWRIEIRSRPELTAKSSGSDIAEGEGGFFTQADYTTIVRYAADRFITIVPEVEMPGHAWALVNALPEAGCNRENVVCPDSTATWRILDDVVREVAAMTPGPWFHIGGDEVATLSHDEYVRFIERAEKLVNRHGKRMISWEESAAASLSPTTIVQQWKGDSVHSAVDAGSKVLLSPSNHVYLDMQYTPSTELGLNWAAYIEPRAAYEWDPATLIPGVTDAHIVGVEAPLWTETIRNITAAFYMAVPRLPAIAELAWTPQAARSWDDFRRRIAVHARRWRVLGINFYASSQIDW